MDKCFEYKHQTWHRKEIEGFHIGFNICENIKEMLEDCGIEAIEE